MSDDLGKELERLREENRVLQRKLVEFENSCIEQGSDSALFLSGPMVLFKWKASGDWPVHYVSPNVESLLGFSQREFLEHEVEFVDIVHEDDVEHVASEVLEHIEQHTPSFTHAPYRIYTKSGDIRWILDHTAIIRDEDNEPAWFVGYILDVTDRMGMEKRLRDSEQRWLFALEGSRDGVWDWDAATDEVFYSARWKEMLGYEDHELEPRFKEWETRLHPNDRERVFADLNAHLEGRSPWYENTHRLRCKDDTYKWILVRGKVMERDGQGNPLRVIGTHTDVTDRKEAEEELFVSRANLAMAQSLTRVGNWSWNNRTGEIEWSEEVYRIYERNPAQGPPDYEDYLRYQHPEDGERLRAAIRKAIETSGAFDVEHRIVLPGGQVKHLHALGQVLRNDSGSVTGLFGTTQDITERKEAEAVLQSYAGRIALASQVAGLGIWEWSIETGELTWDQRMYDLYEVEPDTFPALVDAWRSRLDPRDLPRIEESLGEAVQNCGDWHEEFRIRLPGGGSRIILAAGRVMRDSGGTVNRMVGINQDVTESRETQRKLERLATTDALTGVSNRGHFMRLAQKELDRSRRYGHPFALLMLDADHFKNVNDTHGHNAGDTVLVAIASSVGAELRNVDILGRVGGEEFAVALPETGREGALCAAERIREAVERQTVRVDTKTSVDFTVSVGVAVTRDAKPSLEQMLNQADKALYRAKQNGRNRIETA